MNRNDIESTLHQILQEVSGDGREILGHFNIYEDLELDSVGLLTLATQIENRFKIFLPAEVDHIPRTVNEFISYIEKELLRDRPEEEVSSSTAPA